MASGVPLSSADKESENSSTVNVDIYTNYSAVRLEHDMKIRLEQNIIIQDMKIAAICFLITDRLEK